MGQIESPELRPHLQLGALALLVVSSAAAGAAAGFAFDATRGYLDPEVKSGAASEEQIRQGMELHQAVSRRGSALGAGCGGAIIVGVFGLAVGLLTHSTARAGLGLVYGAALGAAFGAISGYVTQEISEYAISNSMPSTTSHFIISIAFWLGIGIAAQGTFILAGSRRLSTDEWMMWPVLGAVLAAVLTPILATVAFPVDFKGRIPPVEKAESYFVGTVGAALLAMGTGMGFRETDQS